MKEQLTGRRNFLRTAGSLSSMAMLAALPQAAMAHGAAGQPVIEDAVRPAAQEETPKYHVRFAVCGMSHDHIYGMVGAVQRGGGELVAIWGGEDDKLAIFTKRFPGVKVVKTQDEILNDPSIQLVLSSQVANERAPLGGRVMRHGKAFLP